jgi:hypothetical protein
MNAIPSPAILAGMVAGFLLPLLLALLSHGPWKISSPGRRFHVSAALVSVGWIFFLVCQESYDVADLIASLMIWLTALLVAFSFWSLLAWGFTISLLAALARARQPLTFAEWVAEYTGGDTVETFARDRLSLLLRAGLARMDGDDVCLTPGWAPRLAWLIGSLRRLFGVEP